MNDGAEHRNTGLLRPEAGLAMTGRVSQETWVTIASVLVVSAFVFSTFWGFSLLGYSVAVGVAAVLALWRPTVGLSTVLFCTIVWEHFFTLQGIPLDNGGELKLYPVDIILGASLVGAFLPHWRGRRVAGDGAIAATFGVFGLVMLGHLAWAMLNPAADVLLAVSAAKNLLWYAVITAVMVRSLGTPASTRRLIGWFVAGVTVVAGFAVWGLLVGHGLWTDWVPLSTTGTRLLNGAHTFSATLGLIGLIVWLIYRWPVRQTDIPTLLLMAVLTVGILGSLQRHLWLGVVVVGCFVLIAIGRRERRNLWKLAAIGGWLGIVALGLVLMVAAWRGPVELGDSALLLSVRERAASLWSGTFIDSSVAWRVASWQQAFQTISDHWLVGIGLGQTITFTLGTETFTIPIRDLHNDFLALAVQLGVVATGLFLLFLAAVATLFAVVWARLPRVNQPLVLSAAAALLLFIWAANFGVYFDLNSLVVFFWFALGFLLVGRQVSLSERSEH